MATRSEELAWGSLLYRDRGPKDNLWLTLIPSHSALIDFHLLRRRIGHRTAAKIWREEEDSRNLRIIF